MVFVWGLQKEFSFSFSLQTLFRSARPNRFKTLKTTRFYQVLSTIRLLSDLWFMFLNTKVCICTPHTPPIKLWEFVIFVSCMVQGTCLFLGETCSLSKSSIVYVISVHFNKNQWLLGELKTQFGWSLLNVLTTIVMAAVVPPPIACWSIPQHPWDHFFFNIYIFTTWELKWKGNETKGY